MAARNFRGTIRQESIAPSAPGGRTSASRTWSRDRREEFNCRSSIADTVDYNFKARSSGLRRGAHLADGGLPVTSQTPCGRRLFDCFCEKSMRSRCEPCPGMVPIALGSGGRMRLPPGRNRGLSKAGDAQGAGPRQAVNRVAWRTGDKETSNSPRPNGRARIGKHSASKNTILTFEHS